MDRLCRTLEITIISGEDLRIHGKPLKKNAFVTVSPDSDSSSGCYQYLRSTKETRGGSNPRWNEKLVIELPSHKPFVKAEVYCGHSLVGTVRIPVSDFSSGRENYLHLLSYRLKDRSGDRNGILNISVRTVKVSPEYAPDAVVLGSKYGYGNGYGLGGQVGDVNFGGWVAIGIPVSRPCTTV